MLIVKINFTKSPRFSKTGKPTDLLNFQNLVNLYSEIGKLLFTDPLVIQ